MLNFDQGDGLIKEIMNSKDPISVVRQHVLKNGGFWNDTDVVNKSAFLKFISMASEALVWEQMKR